MSREARIAGYRWAHLFVLLEPKFVLFNILGLIDSYTVGFLLREAVRVPMSNNRSLYIKL